jgi:hypothetical protein
MGRPLVNLFMKKIVSIFMKWSRLDLPFENPTLKLWYSDVSGIQIFGI